MGIPICDKCARGKLGYEYDKINKDHKFTFFVHCVVCNDYFKDKYCIPELERKGESGLDAIKRYLNGFEIYLPTFPSFTAGSRLLNPEAEKIALKIFKNTRVMTVTEAKYAGHRFRNGMALAKLGRGRIF